MGFDFVVMFIASLLDDILYGRHAYIGVECCIGDVPRCICVEFWQCDIRPLRLYWSEVRFSRPLYLRDICQLSIRQDAGLGAGTTRTLQRRTQYLLEPLNRTATTRPCSVWPCYTCHTLSEPSQLSQRHICCKQIFWNVTVIGTKRDRKWFGCTVSWWPILT
jgi:hypothetical protein